MIFEKIGKDPLYALLVCRLDCSLYWLARWAPLLLAHRQSPGVKHYN